MSDPEFIVQVFVYGHNQARLEADILMPIKPPSLAVPGNTAELEAWARDMFRLIMHDLKYSYPMICEFCDKPARENLLQWLSRAHLPPKGQPGWMGQPSPGPMATAYIHAICSLTSSCGRQAKGLGSYAKMMNGIPPGADDGLDYVDDPNIYPRNGSCAGCMTEASVAKAMSKCSNCKTTVYCSRECQKDDWARHKKVCKVIKGTRFVNSAGTVETYLYNPVPLLPK